MRNIIIGDIHGCYYTLLELLSKVQYNKQLDKLIFVGDYIDRGKNSYEVVDYLINLQKEIGENKVICLLGNHEHMAMTNLELWMYNGGNQTISSMNKHNVDKCYFNNWFSTLPLHYETDKYIVCHAGLPKVKLSDNTLEDIIWDRYWLDLDKCHIQEPNEKQVIFGHTPQKGKILYTNNGNIGIDTACVYGYKLTALIREDCKDDIIVSVDKDELD